MCAHNVQMEKAILKYYIALIKCASEQPHFTLHLEGKSPEQRNYNEKCTILNISGTCFCTKCAKIFYLLGLMPLFIIFQESVLSLNQDHHGFYVTSSPSSNKLNRNHHARRRLTSFELRGMLAKSRRNHPHKHIAICFIFFQINIISTY